jgi:hypothetical protein
VESYQARRISLLEEKVYQLLLEHRAGTEAIVQIGDLAAAVGANRRTIASILNELRKDHNSTKRFGQYDGLVITFSDMIYIVQESSFSVVG